MNKLIIVCVCLTLLTPSWSQFDLSSDSPFEAQFYKQFITSIESFNGKNGLRSLQDGFDYLGKALDLKRDLVKALDSNDLENVARSLEIQLASLQLLNIQSNQVDAYRLAFKNRLITVGLLLESLRKFTKHTEKIDRKQIEKAINYLKRAEVKARDLKDVLLAKSDEQVKIFNRYAERIDEYLKMFRNKI